MTNTPLERIWDQHVIADYGGGRALLHIDRHFAQESTSARAFDGLRRAVETELSVRQRRIFEAIVLNQVPLDVLTIEMDTNRGAIYKTMFDARRKLRATLAAEGLIDP